MRKDGLQTLEKRFVIPKDSIGFVRLKETQAVVREIKSEFPEVLSLCVFGSNIKGKARKDSDIDGYLFVDSLQLAKKLKCDEKDIVVTEIEDREFYKSKKIHFNEDIASRYSGLIREQLKTRLCLTDRQVEHVRTRPISESIIDNYIEDWKGWDKNMQLYEIASIEYDRSLDNGDFLQNRPKLPGNMQTSFIPYIFHMAIGQGIEKYRSYLIKKLCDLGNSGERIWKEVIEGTEMMENYLNTGTNIYYPRTLEEAKEQYLK